MTFVETKVENFYRVHTDFQVLNDKFVKKIKHFHFLGIANRQKPKAIVKS